MAEAVEIRKGEDGEEQVLFLSTKNDEIGAPKKTEVKKVKYTKIQWIILGTLAFGNLTMGTCISLQAPFFPQEAEKKGATPSQYGLVFSIYQLSMFLCAPIAGKIIPIVKPKWMYSIGLSVVGISSLVFGFLDKAPAGMPFFLLCLLVRVVEGVGSAAAKTAGATIIATTFADSVSTAFSSLELFLGLGLIIGPSIGGVLYEVGGFGVPFFCAAALCFIDVILIVVFLPKVESKEKNKTGNMLKFLSNPSVWLDALIIFQTYNCIGFNQTTLEPHLRNSLQLSPMIVGFMFVVAGGVYALATPIWGRICSGGVNPRFLNIIGGCFLVICYLFVGPIPIFNFAPNLASVIVSLAFFGMAGGGTQVCAFFCSIKSTRERGFPDDVSTYGLVSALYASSCAFGAFVGPTAAGVMLENIGYGNSTAVIVGFEVLVIILTIADYVHYRVKREPKLKIPQPQEQEPLLKPRHFSQSC